jgi:hypothetical protein
MFTVVCIICALATSQAAFANDSEMGVAAGDAIPVSNRNVRMDSESVQIVCLKDYALYRVDFKFVNDSPRKQKVRLGFPFIHYSPGGATEWNFHAAQGFHAWFNGREIPVTPVRGLWPAADSESGIDQEAVWYAHDVTFPPGASMVTVYYVGSSGGSVATGLYKKGELPGGLDDAPLGFFPYQVSSGAKWKGRIGKSVIRYTLGEGYDPDLVALSTRRWIRMWGERDSGWLAAMTRPRSRAFQWTYRNYQPSWKDDVEIIYPELRDEWRTSWVLSSWWATPEDNEASAFWPLVDTLLSGDFWYDDDGLQVGDAMQVDFEKERTVREIRVTLADEIDFEGVRPKQRPRKLRIDFSNGTTQVLELVDGTGMQFFRANARADGAKVTLLDVYGAGAGTTETVVPHVEFAANRVPRFSTFRALTGITAAPGFREPAALASPGRYPVTPFSRAVTGAD